ncbi:MAG: MFS transporter [Thermodesulfovibrionales bacterium]|nr:MFS transporter [Thermodesulfovibrionales bacterium]
MAILDKRIISWCLYDFANSSYSAVIASVIFPVFYANYIVGNDNGQGDLWWGRAISLSMAIVACTAPFLGGVADHLNLRKRFLLFFTLLCTISVASFTFLEKGMVLLGFILIVLANIGLEGGIVFYNSYLTLIAKPPYRGRVSAWGFGVGYGGSIISLLLALLLVHYEMIEMVWLMVSFFFLIFSLPTFFFLPPDKYSKDSFIQIGSTALKQIFKRLSLMIKNKQQRRFLVAYLLYEDGVSTVIVFSSIYAATTLGFLTKELLFMYLVIQLTALLGSFLFARSIDLWGAKKVITASLIMWLSVSILAYIITTKPLFFAIACLAGLGLGTIQAASRALYARFIPLGQESEYFGVYSFIGKSSAIIGPLVFGHISSTFGNQRLAILAVAFFFLAGLVLLQTVKTEDSHA